MDICNEFTYDSYLLNLLDNYASLDEINNQLKINIYITLMTLSGGYYNKENEQKKLDLVEDFARKVNNLKVKIQLKRKEDEINKLLDDIKKLYEDNNNLIDKHNVDKLDIITILDSKEPKDITKIVDVFTKEKINKINNKAMYDNLRNNVISDIFDNDYHIMDNTLYIDNQGREDVVISLDMFYQVFDYLKDIYDYPQPFNKNDINRMHTSLIGDIIKFLDEKYIDNMDTLIPVVLTHISRKIKKDNNIDLSKFKIDNIKITDLYKLAEQGKNIDISKCAKWQRVVIPNNYLIERILDILKKGTYYIKDDIFVMEDIVNNISDFKISISKFDLLNIIKEELKKDNY